MQHNTCLSDISVHCYKCYNFNRSYLHNPHFKHTSEFSYNNNGRVEEIIKLNDDHISFICLKCRSDYCQIRKLDNKSQKIFFKISYKNIYFLFFISSYTSLANKSDAGGYRIDSNITIGTNQTTKYMQELNLYSFEELSSYIANINDYAVKINKLMVLV